MNLKHGVKTTLSRLMAVFRDTWTQMKHAQLMMVASSLAYTTILSIIPVLAVAFAIFHAFGGMEKLYAAIEPIVIQNLAESSSEEAMKAIRGFLGNIHAGTIGTTGLIGLIATCMTMLYNIEVAINRIWGAPMEKNIFQRVAQYWLFITLGPLGVSIVIGTVGSMAATSELSAMRYIPGGLGMYLLTAFAFFVLYKFVPNKRVHWMPATISGFVTALTWNIGRWAYSIYTTHFVSYSKIYGSLAAIPILLLWIYIVWVIVLAGAALTAALQRRYDFDDIL